MRPALVPIMSAQGGVFTRQQALAAGYTAREIKALTRPGGPWAVPRQGIYCVRAGIIPLDERALWLLKDRAAAVSCRRPATLSHDSAGRVLEIDMLAVDQPGSHVTLFGPRGTRSNSGLTRHRDMLPLCVEVVDDLTVTSYARTAVDLARLHGYRHGLVAIDSVRNRGVPLGDLGAEVAPMAHHPHKATARAALRDSDDGAESVLETLGRELVESLGLGEVATQFAVRIASGRTVWCDIRVGCHLFECEGKLKLVSVDEGGVATSPAADVLWKQQARRTDVCAQGFGMSRIVWSDCFAGRERARARLLAEYAVTEARFGRTPTEEQLRFAAANPRRRRPALWTPDLGRAA